MSKIVVAVFILTILTASANAQRGGGITSPRGGAGGGGLSAQEKQDAKQKSRWTMADWLDTKKVIANQNMWLAGNRAKPVEHEFYVAYDQAVIQKEVIIGGGSAALTKPNVTRMQFGAFTSFVGLSGEYFDFSDNMFGWNAQFNLRIFGNSIQNTNFTLIYGGRTRIDNSTATTETFRNQYYGAAFAIYISKQFGIEGLYRQIMEEKSDQNNFLKGNGIEGSVFVDYGIIRIIGTWFSEKLELTDPSQVVTNKNSTGVYAGGKIYF
jgi:hypothetical protein